MKKGTGESAWQKDEKRQVRVEGRNRGRKEERERDEGDECAEGTRQVRLSRIFGRISCERMSAWRHHFQTLREVHQADPLCRDSRHEHTNAENFRPQGFSSVFPCVGVCIFEESHCRETQNNDQTR